MQFMLVGSWAGVTYLCYTVLISPNKDETAVHCCDPALSVLVMFGVWKRLSRSISLAVTVFTFLFLLADYISCRSYVGRVYRMWSLAVSRFSMPLAMIITRKWIYVFSFLSYIGMGLRSSAINLAFCCCVRNIYLPNVRDLNDKKIETKKWTPVLQATIITRLMEMTSLEQIISRKRPINKELVGFDCVKCGREDSKIFRKNYMQSVLKQRTGRHNRT